MATRLRYRVLASSQRDGPLLTGPILTASVPAILQHVNQAVLAAEARVPDGTRLELAIHVGALAPTAAGYLNAQFRAGRLYEPGAPHRRWIPWPEHPHQVATVPQPEWLRIRWVKGEWQILVALAVVAVVVGLLLLWVPQPPYVLRSATPVASATPAFGGTPFRLFWLPWYDTLAVAAGLALIPLGLRLVARTETAASEVVQAHTALRAAEAAEGGPTHG